MGLDNIVEGELMGIVFTNISHQKFNVADGKFNIIDNHQTRRLTNSLSEIPKPLYRFALF